METVMDRPLVYEQLKILPLAEHFAIEFSSVCLAFSAFYEKSVLYITRKCIFVLAIDSATVLFPHEKENALM